MGESASVFGFLSLLPPLLTITLAIATKRVYLSLLLGIALGVLLLQPNYAAWSEFTGDTSTTAFTISTIKSWISELTWDFFYTQLADSSHMQVMLFTTVLSIQVALIHRSGGMQGLVGVLSPLAKTRVGGQVLTWFLGMIIFIDDYANTLLLGSTMRPVADRLKISREKLAYLVDSTAAPVAALALVSTWVAVEISYIGDGYKAAGIDIGSEAFSVFLQTIPVRFYIIFALLLVPLSAILRRDFGPMLAAERRAQSNQNPTQELLDDDSTPNSGHWIDAVLPILTTLGIAVAILATTGLTALRNENVEMPENVLHQFALIIGNGDPYSSLVYGSAGGLLIILGLILLRKSLDENRIVLAAWAGFKHVLPALIILWFAWTLSSLTSKDNLGTGEYLASVLTSESSDSQQMTGSSLDGAESSEASKNDVSTASNGKDSILPIWLFPTLTFVIAAIVAFSTGTSWGTMGTLFPIVIPTVISLLVQDDLESFDKYHPILIGSIGSVLAGAIFGDHCSPISDTTVLSSKASSCDHIAHVRTQMPYALLGGAVAIVFGTIPSAFAVPSWILILLGLAVMAAFLIFVGRNPATETNDDATG